MKYKMVKYDPAYPYFGLLGEPFDKKQHQNEQRGLDKYVRVVNFQTGEWCEKKLYLNNKGLHFKHTGYQPMYLERFTSPATVYLFHVEFDDETTSG